MNREIAAALPLLIPPPGGLRRLRRMMDGTPRASAPLWPAALAGACTALLLVAATVWRPMIPTTAVAPNATVGSPTLRISPPGAVVTVYVAGTIPG